MNFVSELKKVSAHKAASLDMVYTVTLVTDNPTVLALGSLPSDTLLKVQVEEQ